MNFVEVPDLGFLWHLKSCFSDLQSVDLSCYIFVMQYYRGAVIDGDYAVLGITWVQDKRHFSPRHAKTCIVSSGV